MFRNPLGDYAGRLIEAAGCKGLAVGDVHVSEMHANFFVHDGSGTAHDVLELMSEVQRRVRAHAGVWLWPEIVWWGDGELPAAFAGEPEST
jgi:UDP-N-acetylmuramate dehydrogenase